MEMQKQLKCADKVEAKYKRRMDDLNILLENYIKGVDDECLGRLDDYHLCFDYVEPNTYDDQPIGYYRYQISWGGPADEIRFYVTRGSNPKRIEYWYLDWYDGAFVEVKGKDFKTLTTLFRLLKYKRIRAY